MVVGEGGGFGEGAFEFIDGAAGEALGLGLVAEEAWSRRCASDGTGR